MKKNFGIMLVALWILTLVAGCSSSSRDENQEPILQQIGDQTLTAGQSKDIALSATDADEGETLTFCLQSGPSWASVTGSGSSPGPVAGTLSLSPDAAAEGQVQLVVMVIDGGSCDSPLGYDAETVNVTVNPVGGNQAPVLVAIGDQSVNEGEPKEIPLSATDPDSGQTLTFCLKSGPEFATVTGSGDSANTVTGTLTLAPAVGDAAGSPYTVVLQVIDGGSCESPEGLSDEESIEVTVKPQGSNHPPVLANLPGEVILDEGENFSVDLSATDEDAGQTLVFCKESGPNFATVTGSGESPASGSMDLAPVVGDAGEYLVTVRVYDGGDCGVGDYDEASVPVTVELVQQNQPPVLNAIEAVILNEGDTVDLDLSASDPDSNQTLTFCKLSGPDWATVSGSGSSPGPVAGLITLAPAVGQQGGYELEVAVIDGGDCTAPTGLSDSQVVSITVQAQGTNRPPVLTTIDAATLDEGATLTVGLSATDPDDAQTLTFCKLSGPAWATVSGTGSSPGPVTGTLDLSPAVGDEGSYEVEVAVIDGGDCATPAGLSDSQKVAVTVNQGAGNKAPVLSAIGNQSVEIDATKDVALSATDEDTAETLTFCLVSGPSFATVTGSGASPGPVSGNLHLAPTQSDLGDHAIEIQVIDGGSCQSPTGLSDSESFTITVTGGLPEYSDGENPADETSRLNDSAEDAVAVEEIPAKITGYFGKYDTQTQTTLPFDVDLYSFQVNEPGQVLHITVVPKADSGTPQANPSVGVYSLDSGTEYWGSGMAPKGETAEKYIFLPTTGRYMIQLYEWQNLLYYYEIGGSSDAGTSYGYEATIELVNPTPTDLTVPMTENLAISLPDRAALGVYKANLTENQGYQIQLFGYSTLGSELTDLDPVIYVYDKTLNQLINWNDNLYYDPYDYQNANFDSLARFVARTTGEYWIVVDFWSPQDETYNAKPEPKLYLEMLAEELNAATEAEPNNGFGDSWPINPNTSYLGTIDAPTAAGSDSDLFEFFCIRGETYRVTMTGDEDLIPAVYVGYAMVGSSLVGNVQLYQNRLSFNRENLASSSLEFLCQADSRLFFLVSDKRNLFELGAPVGGVTFGYNLMVEKIQRTPVALENPGTVTAALDVQGKIQWYTFSSNSMVEFSLQAVGYYTEPFIQVFMENGYQGALLYSGPAPAGYLDAGNYWIAVTDRWGEGNATGFDYTMNLATVTPEAEAEPNNDSAAAQVPTGHLIAGALSETDTVDPETLVGGDWYKVSGLTPGMAISVYTLPDFSTEVFDLDTVIAVWVVTPNGLALSGYSDANGFGSYAVLANVPAYLAADHYVQVMPNPNNPDPQVGSYLLEISTQAYCPFYNPIAVRPALIGGACTNPVGLAINEFGADPSDGAIGDWNKDGTRDGTGDEFIEFYNQGVNPIDLGGLMYKDAGTFLQHIFHCGASVDAGYAYVVFGHPVTDENLFGGSTVSSSTNDPTYGLSLNNTGDTIGIYAPGQLQFGTGWTEVDPNQHVMKLVYTGTSNDNSSQQRCLSTSPAGVADCDQGEAFVLTTNIPGVDPLVYTATPGWRASNQYFVEPPPMAGESCADALVLEAAGTIGDQNSESYADDYNYTSHYSTLTGNCSSINSPYYEYDGPDGVFQIVAPQSTTSMTVTLESAFDGAILVVGDCANMASSCVGAADSEFDPAGGFESVTGPVTAGQTYFIIVDGYYSGAAGAYSVTVSFSANH